jgi:Protein of unknown function (DUF1559)
MTQKGRARRRGVSSADLLVLLALLLFAAALLVPAVQRVREAAARMQSTNNLKQLALGMHSFHDANKSFPPAVGEFANKTGSAHFFILPYIEQQALYNQGTDAVWDNSVWSKRIAIFIDMRDTTGPPDGLYKSWLATTNYPVNWLVFKDGGATFAQIPDGTSNTLMFAQRYQVCNGAPTAWGYPSLYSWAPVVGNDNQALFQMSPRQDECDPTRAQAIGGVMLIALCDGSVRSLNPRLTAQTWANLCDPADGNVLGADF